MSSFHRIWFPITDIDQVYQLEFALEEKKIQDFYTYFIKRNLRPFAETHVKQLMSKMFSLEVAQQFNMAGTDGKKSFSALKIYQIFCEMANKYYVEECKIGKSIDELVNMWLNSCHQRINQCKRKRSDYED